MLETRGSFAQGRLDVLQFSPGEPSMRSAKREFHRNLTVEGAARAPVRLRFRAAAVDALARSGAAPRSSGGTFVTAMTLCTVVAGLATFSETTVMKKKKQPIDVVVPRLGPPENLRPGGAHKNKATRTRAESRRRAIEAASE